MAKSFMAVQAAVISSAICATAAQAQAELTPISEELTQELYGHYLQSKPDPFKGKVRFCLDKPNSIVPGLISFLGGLHEIEGSTVFVQRGCRIPIYQCGKDGTIRLVRVEDYSRGGCPVTYQK